MFVAWSGQPFPRYEIVHECGDDMCIVNFYISGHTAAMPDGDTAYYAKIISINIKYDTGLFTDIRDNYSEWLAMALDDEKTEIIILC